LRIISFIVSIPRARRMENPKKSWPNGLAQLCGLAQRCGLFTTLSTNFLIWQKQMNPWDGYIPLRRAHRLSIYNVRRQVPFSGVCIHLRGRPKKIMQPTNPNAHTYVDGTDVETHGYAVTHKTFLKPFICTVLYIFPLLSYQCTVDCGIWKKVAC
jgi:hypothetical protein